jgi:hypothetical protein
MPPPPSQETFDEDIFRQAVAMPSDAANEFIADLRATGSPRAEQLADRIERAREES